MRRIGELGVANYLDQIERGQLTDGFWEIELGGVIASKQHSRSAGV